MVWNSCGDDFDNSWILHKRCCRRILIRERSERVFLIFFLVEKNSEKCESDFCLKNSTIEKYSPRQHFTPNTRTRRGRHWEIEASAGNENFAGKWNSKVSPPKECFSGKLEIWFTKYNSHRKIELWPGNFPVSLILEKKFAKDSVNFHTRRNPYVIFTWKLTVFVTKKIISINLMNSNLPFLPTREEPVSLLPQ